MGFIIFVNHCGNSAQISKHCTRAGRCKIRAKLVNIIGVRNFRRKLRAGNRAVGAAAILTVDMDDTRINHLLCQVSIYPVRRDADIKPKTGIPPLAVKDGIINVHIAEFNRILRRAA